jgi:uncharacterized membrane protein YfcA
MYQAIGLYQGKKITVSKQDHGTHWPLHLLILSLSCALLAGILGGLLGVGSGFVMGPLFIELGIAPQVCLVAPTLLIEGVSGIQTRHQHISLHSIIIGLVQNI